MTDPITNRVLNLMAQESELFIPLRRLYRMLSGEGLLVRTDLSTFRQLLASDERFELFPGDLTEDEALNPELEAALEVLDLYPGERVKLRSRQASDSDLMRGFLTHLRQLNGVLESMWRVRSGDDPEGEAEILQMLLWGDMVEREVQQLLSELDASAPGESVFDEGDDLRAATDIFAA